MLKRSLLAAGALTAAAFATQASSAELKSIGLSFGTLSNPFYISLASGIEAEARKINPDVKITTVGYEWDLATQANQIDNFIAAGVSIILTNAGDPVALGPAIKKAQAAGIPVIAVDNGAEAADATIMTDNVAAGKVACQYIVDKLGGAGDVIIENSAQVSAIVDRVKGCKEVRRRPVIAEPSEDHSR
jgi:ribose transport system substrate-binding protein